MQYDSCITLTATGANYRGSIIRQIKSEGHSIGMFEEGHNKHSAVQKLGKKQSDFSHLFDVHQMCSQCNVYNI
jgi:hypothetical protein